MLKVGLTGGIGSGKSTAVDAFRVLGVPIIDADQIAKDIVKPGQPALSDIINTFGKNIVLKNGELDRQALKLIVFSDSGLLAQLEDILHPRIKAEITRQIDFLENLEASPSYIIVDIPLLVEKNYKILLDYIIVVDCLLEQQIQRVRNRDNLTENTINKIIKTQSTRQEKREIATHILDNTQSIESLINQVKSLHEALISLA